MASVKKLVTSDYQVFGTVQGVFFRKYTKIEADKLKLGGWVKNSHDGSVVGTVQGPEDKVTEMKKWLMTKGSPHSFISRCEFRNEHSIEKMEFSGFKIRH